MSNFNASGAHDLVDNLPDEMMKSLEEYKKALETLTELRIMLRAAEYAEDTKKLNVLLGTKPDGSPLIDGKNAEIRAAQLADACREETDRVRRTKDDVDRAEAKVRFLQARLETMRSVLRWLNTREEEE